MATYIWASNACAGRYAAASVSELDAAASSSARAGASDFIGDSVNDHVRGSTAARIRDENIDCAGGGGDFVALSAFSLFSAVFESTAGSFRRN
mmetsp:Transcript_1996/g.6392  ORF Transcript_1996/g.6392 Transcript_1996/m.6392 type:complete len:93 (-) Transcript_1996:2985-3263(-)